MDDLAAATFVPYHDDGAVNYAGVDAHARDLAAHGVLIAFSTRALPAPPFPRRNSVENSSFSLGESVEDLAKTAWKTRKDPREISGRSLGNRRKRQRRA